MRRSFEPDSIQLRDLHSYETCTSVFTIQHPVMIITAMNEAATALTTIR
jgi:hypothetical protein